MLPAIAQRLLVGASVIGTTGIARLEQLGVTETTHTLNWGFGVSAGEITIETADEGDYTGTWAPIIVVPFSGTAPKQDYVRIQGTYPFMRHRVSQTVVGGNVTTKLTGAV